LIMVTRLIRNLVLASLAVAVLSASTKIQAQDRYPSRTVKLVVAFAPDGVADIMGGWSRNCCSTSSAACSSSRTSQAATA
jgi:hypothetical protein